MPIEWPVTYKTDVNSHMNAHQNICTLFIASNFGQSQETANFKSWQMQTHCITTRETLHSCLVAMRVGRCLLCSCHVGLGLLHQFANPLD